MFPKFKGMKFLEPEQGNEFKAKVTPGQEYLVVIAIEPTYGFSSSSSDLITADGSFLV
jgi:hypothetical protein